jgi:hypothetical protein
MHAHSRRLATDAVIPDVCSSRSRGNLNNFYFQICVDLFLRNSKHNFLLRFHSFEQLLTLIKCHIKANFTPKFWNGSPLLEFF